MRSCFDVGCGPIINLLQGLGKYLKSDSQKRWELASSREEKGLVSAAKDP